MINSRNLLGFAVTLLVLAAVGGVGFTLQREKTAELRFELVQAQSNAAELTRLQSDNERLKREQVSPAELAALREDHAAVMRLRAELEALQKSASSPAR